MRGSLNNLRDIWKFRVRMALALRKRVSGTLATPEELDHLVAQQTAYWQQRPPLTPGAAQQAMSDLNGRSISAFVFSVRDRRIRMWDKRPAGNGKRTQEQESFFKRALLYQAFLAKTLARGRLDGTFDFVLDVNDMPADSVDLPIFSFQKKRGAHNPLMPDVDFFHMRWYRDEQDTLSYEQKTNTACFVGSSTGGWMTTEDVRRDASPRLRAAAYFHGNPHVLFKIAKAAHCRSDEARALLMSKPYFSDPMSWEDQLRHRFLISIDGNGAACSRLVKSLFSNGVVVKYDSPYELYYFSALKPDQEYLPALQEQDIERTVDLEASRTGTFKHIAESGQRFAHRYLTIRSVMDYSARLLRAYVGLSRQ